MYIHHDTNVCITVLCWIDNDDDDDDEMMLSGTVRSTGTRYKKMSGYIHKFIHLLAGYVTYLQVYTTGVYFENNIIVWSFKLVDLFR